MKVLYIFRALAVYGGIERVLVDKMNYLSAQYGYDVFLITTDQGGHPVPYHLEESIKWEDMGILFYQQYQYSGVRRLIKLMQLMRLFERKLSERLHTIRPDIIVATTANYIDLCCITKVKGEIPLVVESHSICQQVIGRKTLQGLFHHIMYRFCLRKAYVIVALTDNDASDWRRYFPHVTAIQDIVNINKDNVSSLKNKRVIFVGRFDYQKRPMEMIRIWQKVFSEHSDWQLDIYGDGEQRHDLLAIANALNMNIHVYPPTSNIFECYRESSILVSTSLFEPFGLVIPEAMSCGLPIVAYDCPYGPAAIISDGVDGFLIRNRDAKAFSEKICLLMEDRDMRVKMGQAAITSSQRYQPDMIMQKWKSLFEVVLNKNPTTRLRVKTC